MSAIVKNKNNKKMSTAYECHSKKKIFKKIIITKKKACGLDVP